MTPSGPAAFVIPFWSDGAPHRLRYLREAIDSVRAQSDPDIVAIVVDDCSESRTDVATLLGWAARDHRLVVRRCTDNRGPGRCRNVGVQLADDLGAPFVCFLDADDLAHPDRVRTVRAAQAADPDASIVYSGFQVVDEHGEPVPYDQLVGGIRTLAGEIAQRPLSGYDCWITLAVERDNLTIPSALNVATTLAAAVPFPATHRFHEDTHTWLRYSASGAKIVYSPGIPSRYRVPQPGKGSESRDRAGGTDAFNRLRAQTIGEGLAEAVAMGVQRGVVTTEQGLTIRTRYLLSVASMLRQEGSTEIALDLVAEARLLSPEDYRAHRHRYQLG
jgi:Glycosyl transferase family 2